MRLKKTFACVAFVGIACVTAFAASEIDLENVKCVMNPKGDASAEHFVKYKGGKVFFCCENCPKGFTSKVKSDEKVAAKGNHQLVSTKQAKQSKCPFSGGELNEETGIEVAGAKIAFCCENCQGKAKDMKDDEQLLALFGDKAFKKAGFEVGEKE